MHLLSCRCWEQRFYEYKCWKGISEHNPPLSSADKVPLFVLIKIYIADLLGWNSHNFMWAIVHKQSGLSQIPAFIITTLLHNISEGSFPPTLIENTEIIWTVEGYHLSFRLCNTCEKMIYLEMQVIRGRMENRKIYDNSFGHQV